MTAAAEGPAWTTVARLEEFGSERKLVRTIGDLEILLCRIDNEIVAVHNVCTHLGEPLDAGQLMSGHLTCPFHGACFELKTGFPVSGPAVHALHRFPVKLEVDAILVDLSRRPVRFVLSPKAT